MKRILTAIGAIIVMWIGMSAQDTRDTGNVPHKETRTEVLTYIASLPEVSVTYLTKTMLQKFPKDRAESPLGVLVDKGEVESIRVFELGNEEAEAAGKKLINAYISELPDYSSIDPSLPSSQLELLMLQNNPSNEVIMYGITELRNINTYETVLMYSKAEGKKTILIILSGSIQEKTIGELIDSFSR